MTRPTLATLIALIAMPLSVLAQDTGRSTGSTATGQTDTPTMFKELDKNQDGQISQSEAKRSADVSSRFSSLDTDKNKQISVSEWQSDDKLHPRGAAGVSGESRELQQRQSPPSGMTGEGQRSTPGSSTPGGSSY